MTDNIKRKAEVAKEFAHQIIVRVGELSRDNTALKDALRRAIPIVTILKCRQCENDPISDKCNGCSIYDFIKKSEELLK